MTFVYLLERFNEWSEIYNPCSLWSASTADTIKVEAPVDRTLFWNLPFFNTLQHIAWQKIHILEEIHDHCKCARPSVVRTLSKGCLLLIDWIQKRLRDAHWN